MALSAQNWIYCAFERFVAVKNLNKREINLVKRW